MKNTSHYFLTANSVSYNFTSCQRRQRMCS